MAMRNYGVETKGLCFELTDFQKLMNNNAKNIIDNGILDKMGIVEIKCTTIDNNGNIKENDLSLVDLASLVEIIDFVYEIDYATFIGDFEGYFENEKTQERTYFNDNDIIILELKKNDLYNKYENKEEIIEELKETLSKVGIIVDNDYIEEHFGYISGSYFA